MALVGGITEKREIPHEPGEWMLLRRLSWKQLEEAADVKRKEFLEQARDIGPMLRDLQGARDRDDVRQALDDPLNTYDQGTLLRHGIAGWSYAEEVTPDNIDLLDAETAQWAARAIATLHKPDEGKAGSNDSSN